jgi:hypothetical protein
MPSVRVAARRKGKVVFIFILLGGKTGMLDSIVSLNEIM